MIGWKTCRVLIIACAFAAVGDLARAELFIDLSSAIVLQPDTANQQVVFTVYSDESGGETTTGLDLNAQISTGTDLVAPIFDNSFGGEGFGYDLQNQALWSANNNGESDGGSQPSGIQIDIANILTDTGTVTVPNGAANAVGFVTLSFDTTGVQPGLYGLFFVDTLNGATTFFDVGDGPNQAITVIGFGSGFAEGVLQVVPEPTSLIFSVMGLVTFAQLSRRRRRAG